MERSRCTHDASLLLVGGYGNQLLEEVISVFVRQQKLEIISQIFTNGVDDGCAADLQLFLELETLATVAAQPRHGVGLHAEHVRGVGLARGPRTASVKSPSVQRLLHVRWWRHDKVCLWNILEVTGCEETHRIIRN